MTSVTILIRHVQVDTADNAGLTPITSQISSIEFADPTKRRRKREARQGRQASAAVMVDLSVANANLVEGVAINITEILGSTSIDNYYYYDVRVLHNFYPCIALILGIHD